MIGYQRKKKGFGRETKMWETHIDYNPVAPFNIIKPKNQIIYIYRIIIPSRRFGVITLFGNSTFFPVFPRFRPGILGVTSILKMNIIVLQNILDLRQQQILNNREKLYM